jgi:hypothetical protein
VATKKPDKDRKAKIAEMQRQAKAAERRRTLTIVGAAGVVVAIMGGAVAYAIISDESRVPDGPLTSLGVAASAASCDPITDDPTTGSGQHVDGTVKYATVPPTSGEHNPAPEFPNRGFYTADDRPQMEKLVHNLEHGYTVLWYDDTANETQLATLRGIAEKARDSDQARDKFIVSAWDTAYGTLPEGKHFAMSHWSAEANDLSKQMGHRQLCGDVSGAVVNDFITKYPLTSAPEPGAQ